MGRADGHAPGMYDRRQVAEIRMALRRALARGDRRMVVKVLHRYALAMPLAALSGLLVDRGFTGVTLGELLAEPVRRSGFPTLRSPRSDDQVSEDVVQAVIAVLKASRKPLSSRQLADLVHTHPVTIVRALRHLADRVVITHARFPSYAWRRDQLDPVPTPPRTRTRPVFYINA